MYVIGDKTSQHEIGVRIQKQTDLKYNGRQVKFVPQGVNRWGLGMGSLKKCSRVVVSEELVTKSLKL